jgi:hypothetical protein
MTLARSPFTWDELATWRWGDAIGDPTPGISVPGQRHLGKAIQNLAGFLMWGSRTRADVLAMGSEEQIPQADLEQAADVLEVVRETTDDSERWRLT